MVALSNAFIYGALQRLTPEEGAPRPLSHTELDALTAEWRALIDQCSSPHLFDLPEWGIPAFHTHGIRTPFSAITARHDGQLIGLLPLLPRDHFLKAIPALVLRGISNQLSPRSELIHHPDHRVLATRMAWEALREDRSWRVLELHNVPEDGAANDLVLHAQRAGFRVVTVPAPSTPLITMSLHDDPRYPEESRVYRERLEGKLRRFRQLGEVHLRSYTTTAEGLTRFLNLENAAPVRLKYSALTNMRSAPSVVRGIGLWAEQGDALRIFSLELNGEPISMLYGVRVRGTYYALWIALDTRLAMYSPGQLVMMLALNELPSHGAHLCELVGPALPWKMVWTSQIRSHHSIYIFRPDRYGRTPLASILAVALRGRALWPNLLT